MDRYFNPNATLSSMANCSSQIQTNHAAMDSSLFSYGYNIHVAIAVANSQWLLFDFVSIYHAWDDSSPVSRLAKGACAGIIVMSATYSMDMVRGRQRY
ncbi:mitochondrial adenine nucleotide transporter adnt1 [Phtheirospermum japonicum]|uniref:Mitochondrial adenine nucleotide transporter adnt1 n=1 Tax=Phtheirospermum japonicum TaxID=374723 RepID=A0A830BTT7_9LAMI|nr:mitochondrial adenine nucleotide transporter adnt1 [Phtheirospermum japonicum]